MDDFADRSVDAVTAAAASRLTLRVAADQVTGSNPKTHRPLKFGKPAFTDSVTLSSKRDSLPKDTPALQQTQCGASVASLRMTLRKMNDSNKCFTNYPRWCKMRAAGRETDARPYMRTHG
ncbi:MAG: hypothetical protein MUO77_11645 [Anaerolineales bacterium]|nr:hypothetical protein [Anaerolineales bacterium]